MFKETEQGETQYCPMCLEWAEKYKRLQAENERLKKENERLEQLYQDEHCEVLRLQKGLKYIEKYTHSPIADTVRMGIIRNTIKELLNERN